MFHKVQILNKEGKLIKVVTSEALSRRHWRLFEAQLMPKVKKIKKFNGLKKDKKLKSDIRVHLRRYAFEGY